MSLTPPSAFEVRAFRSAIGQTQAGLADMLGASKRAVESWESEGVAHRAPPAFLRLAFAAVDAGLSPYAVPEPQTQ